MFTYLICVLVFVLPYMSCVKLTPLCLLICIVFIFNGKKKDYSPCSEKEIWPFLKVAISPKPGKPRPPKLVCMYLTSIPTCMNFLS